MAQSDELYHYGVIGMRWGIRRGDVATAYQKATDKRQKLVTRAQIARSELNKAMMKTNTGASKKYKKFQSKADKYSVKAYKKRNGIFSNDEKALKFETKANIAQNKANKYKVNHDKRVAAEDEAKVKYAKAQRKVEKWVRSMNKAFKNQNIDDIKADKINSGKQYSKKYY